MAYNSETNITEFKDVCLNLSPDLVVQKHLIDGSCFFFNEVKKGEEFEFKKDLAKSLNVHIRDIVIVGSGKLGFSIKPETSDGTLLYHYKKFDYDYEVNNENDKSDLDIAIVSSELFDRQLVDLYKHTNSYLDKFKAKKSLANYVLKGWIRPDFTPDSYQITPEIEKVQNKYKMKYGRDINIGIYKSWFFFEKYHKNNIQNINVNLSAL